MPPHFLEQSSNTKYVERFLLGLIDFGLIMALLVVPMMLGGNHAIGRLMLICSAALAGTAWAIHQAICRGRFFPATWATVILAVGLMIPIIQLVPLPEAVRDFLSPHLAKILPLWQSDADPTTRLGNWRCLSLTPDATQAGLVIFTAYALLFIVVAGRVQTVRDLQWVLRLCGFAVLLVALFAIVQHFFGNGKFFWFYEHPYKVVGNNIKGPFVNRNHFAQFMALGIGPILIWIVSHYSNSSSQATRKRNHSLGFSRSPALLPSVHSTAPANSSHKNKSKKGFGTKLLQVTASSSSLRFDNSAQPSCPPLTSSMKAGQFLLAMMAGLVVFACLLSLSRGGSVAMLTAIVVCCGISFSIKGASRRMLGAVTMAGIIFGVSLMIFGYERVCDRLGNLTSGKVELMDYQVGRRAIWETDLRATSYFPIFGTGVGSHCEVYPIFFDYAHHDDLEFTHAENGYIQTLLETGGVGALLLLGAIAMVSFWCFMGIKRGRSDQLRLCLAAITAAIVASLFHSMTDFIWYIPGCAAMTVIMTACAFAAHRLAAKEVSYEQGVEHSEPQKALAQTRLTTKKPVDPSIAWGIVGVMVFVSIMMVQERIGPVKAQPYWDDSIRAVEASTYDTIVLDDLSPKELQKAAQFYTAQVERLKKVVEFQPDHARAHRSLALNYLNLFDVHQLACKNPFSTRHIGDAVLDSNFPSQEAVNEWLHRAFGEHVSLLRLAQYHAFRSVKACPTLGRSYLYLTELCFLNRLSFEQKMQFVDQLLLVRPQCGQSVIEIANASILSGNLEQWAMLTKRVYDMNLDTRQLVLRSLLDNSMDDMLPVMVAIIIQKFEPDHDAALYMISRCKNRVPETHLVNLRRYCATRAITSLEKCTPAEEAKRRCVAAIQYQAIDEAEAALIQIRVAYQRDPSNFNVRQQLARCLIQSGSPREAQEHLKWCLRRKPGNRQLEKLYNDSLAADIDAQARSEDIDAQARSEDNVEVTR